MRLSAEQQALEAIAEAWTHPRRFVIDWVNSRGATPLHVAAMRGELVIATVSEEVDKRSHVPALTWTAADAGRIWCRCQRARFTRQYTFALCHELWQATGEGRPESGSEHPD